MLIRRWILIASLPVLSIAAASALGQGVPPGDSLPSATVDVRHDTLPVEGAQVRSGRVAAHTDEAGRAVLRLVPGAHDIIAAKIGFEPETITVTLRPRADTTIVIQLTPHAAELSGIVVSAARSGRRIEDEPLRVEALSQEEVEEKLRMTPGDITMMLNESSGLRVQTTSPSLGGANVRVQGLRGRYTQILADGLPLYGAQTGGLGLLQIPPMDLAGVEIIKGVASALYGGSALGGVINLVSKRPGEEPARDLLLNQTTLGGTDLVGFASSLMGDRWGYTVLAGGHRQSQIDRDDDGWTDVPQYERGLVRPRLYWTSERGHTAMLTVGTTLERREGGTMDGAVAPSGIPFPERLRTDRFDAGGVARFVVGGSRVISVRGSAAWQEHRHTFGDVGERDDHLTWFTEAASTFTSGTSSSVVGVAVQQERYRAHDIGGFDYAFTTPGVFAQFTMDMGEYLAFTSSARLDRHSEHGTRWSPRVSALLKMTPRWSLRLSGGEGYFAPTPFTEETEVIGLSPLVKLYDIRAERAESGSADLGGVLGPVEMNATICGSVVRSPVGLLEVPGMPGRVALRNVAGPTRTAGGELLLRWKPEAFHVTASYTFVRSTEEDPETGDRRDVPLTPRHQAGLVMMWEQKERARVGVEVYYTGRQALDDNPYRLTSKPYVHIGVMGERRFGRARVYVNAENLLDYRQTRSDPLVLPTRGRGGRWTVDVWGPLEGRVANLGMRLDLGRDRVGQRGA
jgi:outer membrane receptor for ferrienterochelin and colicins